MQERLLVGAWYPEEDFRDLTLILGPVLEKQFPGNPWRLIGETGAESDISVIYASRVRVGDTRWTVEQTPAGWSLFHDSGTLTVTEITDNSATIVLTGYSAICRELAEVNAGYYNGLLKASGASSTRVEVDEVRADRVKWSLSWE